MATHKVPQDVEAEDKLLGPLSLKQLIFTILGLGFGYLTYFFFANVHPLAAIIWIPFTLFFLILGLYQRKDQPAEVFLASAIQFYLTSKKRIWDQDGYEERVVITAPPKVEHQYTKNFTGEQAASHLNSLSTLMDSRGWTTKLASDWQNPQLAAAAGSDRLVQPTSLDSMQTALYGMASPVADIQEDGLVAREVESLMQGADLAKVRRAQETIESARTATPETDALDSSPVPPPAPQSQTVAPKDLVIPTFDEPTQAAQVGVVDPTAQRTNNDGSVEISLR